MKFLRRFNSSDRDAAIVLALVIIVSIVLFPYLSEQDKGNMSFNSPPNSKLSTLNSQLTSSPPNWERPGEGLNSQNSTVNSQLSTVNSKLSPFDPNTASESQLLSLGLSQRQVRNILKYRSRGGRFRVKEDFARLYGLTLEKYRQLEPYISISPEVMAADVVKPEVNGLRNSSSSKVQEVKDSSLFTKKKLRFGETVDINTADTAMLKRIPGIGDYFAMRIVELRKRSWGAEN